MRINPEALRARRDARGWSQEVLAEEAGLTKTTIGNLETDVYGGRPSNIRKLAEALGCDMRDIALAESDAERDALEGEAHVA